MTTKQRIARTILWLAIIGVLAIVVLVCYVGWPLIPIIIGALAVVWLLAGLIQWAYDNA